MQEKRRAIESVWLLSSDLCVAWLLPSLERGFYWYPVFAEFIKMFPRSVVFTGLVAGCEASFDLKVIGKTRFVELQKAETGYGRGIILPPLSIVRHLIKLNPNVVFANGFSIWSVIALLLKPIKGWQVILAYEGSAPTVDMKDSKVRSFARKLMVRFADACITNSQAGKSYLVGFLGAREAYVFARPYEVPDKAFLSNGGSSTEQPCRNMRRPIFLFIGQMIPRKGVHYLLQACMALRREGYNDYTLLVVGDGPQYGELRDLARSNGLDEQVKWVGWVGYSSLGYYLQAADAFVFPTLEDTWGMVVLEAMTFGKAVLCSKWTGAGELVIDGENGYTFDPYRSEGLAELMKKFIDNPELIARMGERSRRAIAAHTPKAAAEHLANVVGFVLSKEDKVPTKPSGYTNG